MRKLALLLMLGLCSCVNYKAMFSDYVSAHRKSHVANVAFYQQFLIYAPISPQDKSTFLRRLDVELKMIEQAEEALGK